MIQFISAILIFSPVIASNSFTVYPTEIEEKPQIEAVITQETQIRMELDKYSWDSGLMYEIAKCESSLNPEAHNLNPETYDDSYGLLQINRYGELANERPSPEWLKDIENNIEYGYKVWKQQGYEAWRNCYNKNQHLVKK